MKLFKKFFHRKQNKNQGDTSSSEIFRDPSLEKSISSNLKRNLKELQNAFGYNSYDFSTIEFEAGQNKASLCFLKTMLKQSQLNDQIVVPLLNAKNAEIQTSDQLLEYIKRAFPGVPYKKADSFHQAAWAILTGYAILLIDGVPLIISFEIGNTENRAITEPSTQTIIRGPKDGFVESLQTNVSLLRRRIKNPHLRFEPFIIGKDTRTTVLIGYIDGITNEEIIKEIRKRLSGIDTSYILDTGNIEEYISDKTLTPFPLVYNSERPDSIAGHMLEGKVAIIMDGSPFVLTVPAVLTDFFEVSEDYFQPYFMASFIRIIRYIAFMIALLLPSLYVAISTFHHELLPTELLISVQAQREGVPFPAVVEILIMELTFEVLREAGVRMPRAVGQTVSIVGALVIGQAAVEAGIVSNVLVIVVAFTAISNFVSPIYNFSISTRLLRFALIFAASVLGLYGVLLSLVIMVIHLTSLRSFGVPYLAPVAPFKPIDHQDVFFRFPIWSNITRPTFLKSRKPIKTQKVSNPSPPPSKGGDSS